MLSCIKSTLIWPIFFQKVCQTNIAEQEQLMATHEWTYSSFLRHITLSISFPPGRLVPFKQADIMLKPLLFEVPGLTAEAPFVGRDWLFTRLEEVLRKTSSCEGRGAVIVGNAGSGKTAIMWRLVTLSCHGLRTPQAGPSIARSPSSSPKCEHPVFSPQWLWVFLVFFTSQSISVSGMTKVVLNCLQWAPVKQQIYYEIETKPSGFGSHLVSGLHTLLSSSPLRFLCWLHLGKRTEIVVSFSGVLFKAWVAQELVFCLKNKDKNIKSAFQITLWMHRAWLCFSFFFLLVLFFNKMWHTWFYNNKNGVFL